MQDIRNAQSDIIGLVDKNGASVASYVYDTWGKLVSIKDGSGNDVTTVTTSVGYKNPYRYRGYKYDTETGLYYCNSRYYNPDWGRFLNADVEVGKVGQLLSHNMFAYCGNNPVNRLDPDGNDWWDYVKAGLIGAAEGAGDACLTLINPEAGAERVAAKLGLAGLITKNGIKIEGFVGHAVHRAIGDGFKRAGVSPQGILDALKNPLKIKDVVVDSMGRLSQRFIGRTGEVVINPETGNIISVNPTSSSKVDKLLRELGLTE